MAEEIDRAVGPFVGAKDFMGVVGVDQGGIVTLKSYGYASAELGVAHSADSVFMIGSVSKQFTAVAILLLEADGKLALTDPVSRHVNHFKPETPITIDQLLRHTAGVADTYSLESYGKSAGRHGRFSNVIDALGEAPLTHEPGAQFAYSNGGYSVAAAVIESVSGMTYEEFLRRRLFAPLGMTRTTGAIRGPVIANRVSGYDPWGRSDLAWAYPVSPAFLKGAGSLWSTAADLLTWQRALHGGRVLKDEQYKKLTDGRGSGYALGVSVFERYGRNTIGHDGRVSGFSSDAAHYPDEDTSIVVLSNVQSVARDVIRNRVAAVVFGEEQAPWIAPPLATTAAEDLQPLAGEYQFGPGLVVTVSVRGERLLARANQGGESELIPLQDGRWVSRMLYTIVDFERNDEGAVDRLVWGGGEGAPRGQRKSE